MLFALPLCTLAFSEDLDLARAPNAQGTRLHAAPAIWLTEGAVSEDAVDHLLQKVPTDEGKWSPCIGQVAEFASKRCTLARRATIAPI